MKEINGIKTNLGNYKYSFTDGNYKKTMRMEFAIDCRESDRQMFERLAKKGYKKITFYYSTTRIRGYYEIIAFCK